jgi:hypothetical protein
MTAINEERKSRVSVVFYSGTLQFLNQPGMLCPDFAGIFPSHATKVQIRMEL